MKDILIAIMPPVPLHPIQNGILSQIRTAQLSLRYGQMRPNDIENDLFNYHLKQLVRRGFVEKVSDGYRLSRSGKAYLVDRNPLDEWGLPQRIKLAAMCLVVKRAGDRPQLLYQLRSRQPMAGQLQLIGGGMVRGESPIVAARRRLNEEAGLQADFTLAGFMRLWREDQQGELYSDILFQVCVAFEPTGTLIAKNDFGEQCWLSLDEAIKLETAKARVTNGFAALLPGLIGPNVTPPLFYLEVHDTTDFA